MAEIVTYLLSDEKWPFILNGGLSKVTISGKVELVKRNLRKVEISGRINLDLKVKWCWCNRP